MNLSRAVTGLHLLHQSQNKTESTLRALPPGDAGTRATLQIMRQLVRQYKKTLPIRQLALSIIDRVRGHKNFAAQVKAVHKYVRNNIRYVRDVNGVETLATPIKTLEYRAGDCDDQATLIATLLESIGHPTRFVAIKLKPLGSFVHVYTETKIGRNWVPVETTEKWPVGMHPPKIAKKYIVSNS